MATNFLELATTLKYLGAKWLLEKKVNFMPGKPRNSGPGFVSYNEQAYDSKFLLLFERPLARISPRLFSQFETDQNS